MRTCKKWWGQREPNSRTLTGLLSPAYFLTKYGFSPPGYFTVLLPPAVWACPFIPSRIDPGLGAARLASTSPQLTFSPGWDQAYRITRFDVEQFLVTAISTHFESHYRGSAAIARRVTFRFPTFRVHISETDFDPAQKKLGDVSACWLG